MTILMENATNNPNNPNNPNNLNNPYNPNSLNDPNNPTSIHLDVVCSPSAVYATGAHTCSSVHRRHTHSSDRHRQQTKTYIHPHPSTDYRSLSLSLALSLMHCPFVSSRIYYHDNSLNSTIKHSPKVSLPSGLCTLPLSVTIQPNAPFDLCTLPFP